MSYDVVVVGGGIGGLTVAAILSARGVKTCLLERQSQVGGCLGRVEFCDLDFEPGMGIYPSFGRDEIYERIFSELPIAIPQTSLMTSPYVVRLSDGTAVQIFKDESLYDELRRAFPECADNAIEFYRLLKRPTGKGALGKLRALWQRADAAKMTLDYLVNTSVRFRQFIDAQLSAFLHTPVERCRFENAVQALLLPISNLYSMVDGSAVLAERLAESIKQSGGVVRLNSPVLRLAYDDSGNAIGVDLLSGETIFARRGIVSNMTIWDTYGKLVGLARTPAAIKKQLASLHGTGAYLIYASMEEKAVPRLPASNFLVVSSEQQSEFTFATSAVRKAGKVAVTLKSRIDDVSEWFAFQSSEEDYVARDQGALEQFWTRIHAALPELGGDIEVCETANPRTFYELTRRKLGMVMGTEEGAVVEQGAVVKQGTLGSSQACRTSLPNVFAIGDTVSNGKGIASICETALALTNELTK